MRFPRYAPFILIVAFMVALWVGLRPHVLPVDSANGVYSSDHGSSVALQDGVLSVGDRTSRYVIETDKVGPYVLSDQEVVAYPNGGLEISTGRGNMKMYLDRVPDPSTISVWGEGAKSYSFHKQAPSVAQ